MKTPGKRGGLFNLLTARPFTIGTLHQPKEVKLTCNSCGRKVWIAGNERREICDKCASKLRKRR